MSERFVPHDIAGSNRSRANSSNTLPGNQQANRLRTAAASSTSLHAGTASPSLLNAIGGAAGGSAGLVIGVSGSVVQAPARLSQIYDASLQRRSTEVSFSAMAFLYSEIVLYMQRQCQGVKDLEERLNKLGASVGKRVLELIFLREGRSARRETTVLGMLQFVHTTVWRKVFGKPADALEKSNEHEREYMLIDNNPILTEFISVPRDRSQLNCAAVAAGLIEAVLNYCKFDSTVSAHSVPTPAQPHRTVYLVKFDRVHE